MDYVEIGIFVFDNRDHTFVMCIFWSNGLWCYRFITFGLTWRDNILEEIHIYFGIHMYTYKMATDSRLPEPYYFNVS